MTSVGRASAGAVAVAVAALMLAVPAFAITVVYRTPEAFTASEFIVTAHVFLGTDLAAEQELKLKLSGPDPWEGTVPADPRQPCQEVNFPVKVRRNGHYTAEITVTKPGPTPDSSAPPAGECSGSEGPTRTFFVLAPPVRPSGVRATADSAGVVTVSWSPNPEPDIKRYRVLRAKDGGGFAPVGETASPSFRDSGAGRGGDYRYQVVALRTGRSADDKDLIASEPSAPVSVARGSAAGVGRASAGASRSPALIDVGRFRANFERLKAQAAGQAPDGAFDPNLPYGEEAELGAESEELGTEEESDDLRRSMGFVAGGALTLAVALHLWWVKREAEREPLEALPPSDLSNIGEPLPG